MIEEFYDSILKTAGSSMVAKPRRMRTKTAASRGLQCVKAIMKFAQRRGLVAQDVARTVRARPQQKRKLEVGVDIPSKEEIKLVIATPGIKRLQDLFTQAECDERNKFWRTFFITAAFTGMRSGELRALRWDDIDFKQQKITIRRSVDYWHNTTLPKSAAGQRTISMYPIVLEALQEFAKGDGTVITLRPKTGLVFPGHTFPIRSGGKRSGGASSPELSAPTISRAFERIQIAAGIDDANGKAKYHPHLLRHFFASMIIERGDFSVKQVTAMTGHTSVQMTYDLYGHLFPSDEDDHKKLAAAEAAMFGTT
jgi:integrase